MSKRIAITGADGTIGTRLRQHLADKYTVRAISRHPIEGEEVVIADIADLNRLIEAFQEVESVVHLAASAAVQTPWDAILQNNIIGTYNVFEAAYQAGVKQVIFASSNHAVGTYEQQFEPQVRKPKQEDIDHLVPPAPDSLYGVSKVFGEALGRYFADQRGLRVICIRIGWITPKDTPEEHGELANPEVAMWQSHEDFAQEIEKCLEADDITFDIFYGISDNPFQFFDLDHARETIGYQPQDSSQERISEHQS